MSASLVGSEMCIRDRLAVACIIEQATDLWFGVLVLCGSFPPRLMWSVSYTHLTLPTICSV
eukprot:4211695-Alexandrium_andersonii.AAC.1